MTILEICFGVFAITLSFFLAVAITFLIIIVIMEFFDL